MAKKKAAPKKAPVKTAPETPKAPAKSAPPKAAAARDLAPSTRITVDENGSITGIRFGSVEASEALCSGPIRITDTPDGFALCWPGTVVPVPIVGNSMIFVSVGDEADEAESLPAPDESVDDAGAVETGDEAEGEAEGEIEAEGDEVITGDEDEGDGDEVITGDEDEGEIEADAEGEVAVDEDEREEVDITKYSNEELIQFLKDNEIPYPAKLTRSKLEALVLEHSA